MKLRVSLEAQVEEIQAQLQSSKTSLQSLEKCEGSEESLVEKSRAALQAVEVFGLANSSRVAPGSSRCSAGSAEPEA